MGFFRTDKDTKAVKKEIDKMIGRGYPLHTKDGQKLYGADARRKLAGLTLAGDSVFDILAAIVKDIMR